MQKDECLVTPVEGSGPKTCGGSANGARCFFPFIYKGVTYTSCTNRDHNQLWCATRAGKYIAHKQWGNCRCEYPPEPPVTPVEGSGPKTCGGSANGARCFFPFIYKGVTYTSCTNRGHNQLWCATRAGKYIAHNQWGNCRCGYPPEPPVTPVEGSGPKTCGGSADGARCFFPFIYKGVTYTSCTNRNHNQLWCATRPGKYIAHKQWGNCRCEYPPEPPAADFSSLFRFLAFRC
ncbi:matrix metalloproteinase-9-like [Corticium candelabrum]|uniref:matrix metalloproteinase-9-like n=1 Tax=Corticium candelabrum TaxID=121492 RepID=UPI002E26ECBB|nr:matrix metalloproteinase-9-like [Corticium candelabrum]